MNVENLIQSLDRFGSMLPEVVRDVSPTNARWKPPDGAWSILEVVCHLADEEEFDFRERIRLVLNDPEESWPPIDPEGWAVARRYNEGDLDASRWSGCVRWKIPIGPRLASIPGLNRFAPGTFSPLGLRTIIFTCGRYRSGCTRSQRATPETSPFATRAIGLRDARSAMLRTLPPADSGVCPRSI